MPPPGGDKTDVTLGEVYRGLQELKACVTKLQDEVTKVRVGVEIQGPKVRRLENVIYGAGAIAASALIMSMISLILKGP